MCHKCQMVMGHHCDNAALSENAHMVRSPVT